MTEQNEPVVGDGDQDEAEYVDTGDSEDTPPVEDRYLPEDEAEEPGSAEDTPE